MTSLVLYAMATFGGQTFFLGWSNSIENIIIITVGDLVPSQVGDRSQSNPQILGLSVPNWSKPFSTDLDLV